MEPEYSLQCPKIVLSLSSPQRLIYILMYSNVVSFTT